MAESKTTMRLERLERDVDEIKETLVDHSQRLDRVEAGIHQLHRHFSDRMDGLEQNLGSRMDRLEQSLGSRLDRLLAATLEERTRNYERLTDIERRLTKLEERDP